MKIVRVSDREAQGNEAVTGKGHLDRILERGDGGTIGMAMVYFEDGARTHWHVHPGEQLLYISEGQARVGNDNGDVITAEIGDTIQIPAGERHWHGATIGHSMTHISITNVGAPDWQGPVED